MEEPFVGLRPFEDADWRLFYGREADIRLVAANLRTARLTLMYRREWCGKELADQCRRISPPPGTGRTHDRRWTELSHRTRGFVEGRSGCHMVAAIEAAGGSTTSTRRAAPVPASRRPSSRSAGHERLVSRRSSAGSFSS